MRWLRYEANGRESYGIIEGDEVVAVKGDPFAGYEMTATRHKLARRQVSGAGDPEDVLRRRAQLRRARHRDGEKARRGAEHPAQRRYRLPRQQRADRAQREHRDPARRRRTGAVRGRAGRGDRHQGQAPVGERGAVLRARLDDRQRHERAHLAARRPHAVARQEHRHVQADGAVDRDRFRPRRGARRSSASTTR